jgi:transcriptional regulator with XRE-family HTH domain
MKRSKNQQKPNTVLRYEREKRGWSQNKLGELIGADPTMISRWECGNRTPDRIYQEKLCKVFNKDAEELGLIEPQISAVSYLDQEIYPVIQIEEDTSPAPTRFLSMGPDELIKRYISEKENFLELKLNGIEWTIPEVVVFDNSSLHLPPTAITVQVDTQRPEYTIPPKIAGRAQDILEEVEHNFYDSTTIRLNDIHIDDHHITLIVSKAHYLQFVATNYAMDALLTQKGWTRSLRDIVHSSTHLCKLEESLLCNHIGVGTLVFTLDNYLVIPVRSRENIATWQQKIGPSISGATSYDDDMWSFKAGPIASWIREGREELGLENSDFMDESDIFFGITRDLLRGGKPELYFATQLNITKARLEQKFKKARDRWENKELQWLEFTNPLIPPSNEKERATFLQEFIYLLHKYQDLHSRPTQIGFTFWLKYMLSQQDTREGTE